MDDIIIKSMNPGMIVCECHHTEITDAVFEFKYFETPKYFMTDLTSFKCSGAVNAYGIPICKKVGPDAEMDKCPLVELTLKEFHKIPKGSPSDW